MEKPLAAPAADPGPSLVTAAAADITVNTVADTSEEATTTAATETTTEEEVDEMPNLIEETVDDTPHDDFDWEAGNKQVLSYSETEIENYLNEYDSTLSSVLENEMSFLRRQESNELQSKFRINTESSSAHGVEL